MTGDYNGHIIVIGGLVTITITGALPLVNHYHGYNPQHNDKHLPPGSPPTLDDPQGIKFADMPHGIAAISKVSPGRRCVAVGVTSVTTLGPTC